MTVLFLDDSEYILRAIQKKLRKEPHAFLFCQTTAEASHLLKTEDVQVLFADRHLETETSLAFLEKVKQNFPDTVVYLLSADPPEPSLIQKDLFSEFVKKPIDYNRVIELLNSNLKC